MGESAWTREVLAAVSQFAPFGSSVLITGPSGTGKELIAHMLHDRSPRVEAPLVPVNCAAISGTLFESHMFGHLKGAFTGANYSAQGCFRAANRGTIFLDEVGELEHTMQAKLLRVIQEQTVVPVGTHEEHPVDVRIVAATNRDLAAEVAAGRFREDLYYRLAVVSIRTLPLASRPEDIELLAEYLISALSVKHGLPFKPISERAVEKLRSHPWPGNVRQLQNVLERSMMVARGEMIEPSDIRFDDVAESVPCNGSSLSEPTETPGDWQFPTEVDGRWPSLDECEREFITATLQRTGYNQTAAARLLKLDRSVLRRRIRRLGIDISPSKPGRPK